MEKEPKNTESYLDSSEEKKDVLNEFSGDDLVEKIKEKDEDKVDKEIIALEKGKSKKKIIKYLAVIVASLGLTLTPKDESSLLDTKTEAVFPLGESEESDKGAIEKWRNYELEKLGSWEKCDGGYILNMGSEKYKISERNYEELKVRIDAYIYYYISAAADQGIGTEEVINLLDERLDRQLPYYIEKGTEGGETITKDLFERVSGEDRPDSKEEMSSEKFKRREFHLEGGLVWFDYDKEGNPVRYYNQINLHNTSWFKLFIEDAPKKIGKRAFEQGRDSNRASEYFRSGGRSLIANLMIYNHLKEEGHKKEANFILNSMRATARRLELVHGGEIVDYSKFPEEVDRR